MSIKISFANTPKATCENAILPVYQSMAFSPALKSLDQDSGGYITYAMSKAPGFNGKSGQILSITMPLGSAFSRLFVLGLGDEKKNNEQDYEKIAANFLPSLRATQLSNFCLYVEAMPGSVLKEDEISSALATGFQLRSYTFSEYKKPKEKTPAISIDIITSSTASAKKLYAHQDAVTHGVFLARDVMNEPANTLYPESYARRIVKELKPLGVDVEVIDVKQMAKLKFLSHLEVGKGSERKPCVVVMRWHGKPVTKSQKKFSKQPISFVGKGITFDTGGISIKPAAGMEAMKMDMGGSAAVVGLMKAIAKRKSKSHIVAIVALAENMPSSKAYRPGDIIPSMSGKTIEVLNTDAEGRLVLNDSLTYVQKTYKPKIVIDLATLTGAILVALGDEYCGAFVNNDDLWNKLESASQKTGEKLWRMPLDPVYMRAMEGEFSDLSNLGTMGRNAGACTAAGFLQHFVEDDMPWAHLDIAGKMDQKSNKGTLTAGGIGFGVRVLDKLVADYYE